MNAKSLRPLLLASLLAVAPLAFPADPVPASPATATPSPAPVLLSDAQMDSVSAGASATALLGGGLIWTPSDPLRPIFVPGDPIRPIFRF